MGSLALLTTAVIGFALSPKNKSVNEADGVMSTDTSLSEKALLPKIPVPSLKDLKWERTQVTDLNLSRVEKNIVVCSEIDGSPASLQVAGSLTMLKTHAARSGCDIRYLGQELIQDKFYVHLSGRDENSQRWIDSNSLSYGMIPTVDQEGNKTPGWYLHDPERTLTSEIKLSQDIINGKELFCALLRSQKEGNPFTVTVDSSEMKSVLKESLPLGIIPSSIDITPGQGLIAELKFDYATSAVIISSLDACQTSTYTLVPLKHSIYRTLKELAPENLNEKQFATLVESTVRMNEAMFGLDSKKIQAGALICVPELGVSSPVLVEKKNQTSNTTEGTAPKAAIKESVVEKELSSSFSWAKVGNPAFSALAAAISKNHPARGGGNCGRGSTAICEISPLAALDKIADRNAKNAAGEPYYPGGQRHAVYIARQLHNLSKTAGSGVIAIKISSPAAAPRGSIVCYPSNAGRFELGSGKGSDKYGHIEIKSTSNKLELYVYDLRTTKPAAGKQSNVRRYEALAAKGEFYAYICTQSYLPSLKQSEKLAKQFNIIGKENVPGIVSHVLEAGTAGIAAVARMPGDPGGASYGKYQFSSKKGSLAAFISFCQNRAEYKSIGDSLKSARGKNAGSVPVAFDDAWIAQAKNNPRLFEKAQEDYLNVNVINPAVQRATQYGFDANKLCIRSFLYSLAVQFGVPPLSSKLDPENNKFDEIFSIARDSLPKQADLETQIGTLLAARDGVLWRMGDYQYSIKNKETGDLYQSIVQNRFREEAGLCYWLLNYEKVAKQNYAGEGNSAIAKPAS